MMLSWSTRWGCPALLTASFVFLSAAYSSASGDVFELRIYTTNDGKLDDLNKRFRDHTVGLFKKHGMESVGYWVPEDGPKSKNTLIYVLKHKSREAAKKSWSLFINDADWKKAFAESRKDGPLVKKVESTFMNVADYSPSSKAWESSKDAVFELRTYRTNPGKLAGLDSRFRDHTIKLFKKHGIDSVAYWHPADQPASGNTLIYIIKHQSRAASKKSWQAFVGDEEWKKVARESQKDGKFLKERPESVYMKATDYSAIK